MPQLRRPLYQRNEGADEDRWCLVFDTGTHRLFVEHEQRRGDTRGAGYATVTSDIDIDRFLGEDGPGRQQLMALIGALFADSKALAA